MTEEISKDVCNPEYFRRDQIIRGMDRILINTKQDMLEFCK